ncbi:MAG: hypothetical protein ISS15_14905 [Alphaproteobacteria bacterium]|nr:hypothetical protein [Alphaproteobacteria bacterium]MBL7098945.1 hypothetical protein [Alphaproteobacteria bacterium]
MALVSSRLVWLALLLATVILAAPLWLVAMPAMPDYPAHLASFWLIGGGTSSHYAVSWAWVPNLASETMVPLLAKLLPLELSTRLFLTATVALWVAGPALIQRALFGRIGFGPQTAALFAYNANFIWGFFNYTFAVGAGLVVLAVWIATDGRRTWAHQAGFAAVFLLLYFAHLFAFAATMLAIVCFELTTTRELVRRAANFALLCTPAAAAFLFLKPHGADSGNLAFNLLDTAQDRIEAAIQIGFDKPATILTALLVVLVLAGLMTRHATVHPRMRIVLAVFTVGTLLAPEWAFGGWAVHLRLPPVLGALTFASLEWRIAPRWQAAAGAAALAFAAGCAALLAADWRHFDAQYGEFRSHMADIRPHARVLTVLDGDSLGWAPDQPYWHMAELSVIDRDAFTPLMFTTAGQHVIRVRPPLGSIAAATAAQGSPPDIDELDDLAASRMEADADYRNIYPYLRYFQCHFDQAVVIRGSGPRSRIPAMLKPAADHSFYAVYDIAHGPQCR